MIVSGTMGGVGARQEAGSCANDIPSNVGSRCVRYAISTGSISFSSLLLGEFRPVLDVKKRQLALERPLILRDVAAAHDKWLEVYTACCTADY
jgi:hypothetical protein